MAWVCFQKESDQKFTKDEVMIGHALNKDKKPQSHKITIFMVFWSPHGSQIWKATREYLNQRGTKIRGFRVLFRAPFLPPFFPFKPCSLSHHFSPLQLLPSPTSPLFASPFPPILLTPGKLRFRYPSDLVI